MAQQKQSLADRKKKEAQRSIQKRQNANGIEKGRRKSFSFTCNQYQVICVVQRQPADNAWHCFNGNEISTISLANRLRLHRSMCVYLCYIVHTHQTGHLMFVCIHHLPPLPNMKAQIQLFNRPNCLHQPYTMQRISFITGIFFAAVLFAVRIFAVCRCPTKNYSLKLPHLKDDVWRRDWQNVSKRFVVSLVVLFASSFFPSLKWILEVDMATAWR